MNQKDEKLLNKVVDLLDKLNREEDPIKIGIYTAKLSFLEARIDKEVQAAKIKEEYQQKIEQAKEYYGGVKAGLSQQKYEAITDKNEYLTLLDKNREFDVESPDFAFQEELESAGNNVEDLISYFRNNGNDVIADKIEETAGYREGYKNADELMKSKQQEVEEVSKNLETSVRRKQERQTALITQNAARGNIFVRFFRAIKEGWKEFRRTKALQEEAKWDIEMRGEQLSKHEDNQREQMQDEREQEIAELDEEYEQAIARLNEQYNQRLEQIQQEYDEREAEQVGNNQQKGEEYSKNRMEQFRQQLANEEAKNRIAGVVLAWKEMKENGQEHEIEDHDQGDQEGRE